MKATKGFAAQSATLINPRRCSLHFVPEQQKEGRQVLQPILRRDIAEATVRGVGNSRKSDTNLDSKIERGDEEEATEAYNFGTSRR